MNDTVHRKPKDSTPRLLELIQHFGNVAGYKINAQKSVAFLYSLSLIHISEPTRL